MCNQEIERCFCNGSSSNLLFLEICSVPMFCGANDLHVQNFKIWNSFRRGLSTATAIAWRTLKFKKKSQLVHIQHWYQNIYCNKTNWMKKQMIHVYSNTTLYSIRGMGSSQIMSLRLSSVVCVLLFWFAKVVWCCIDERCACAMHDVTAPQKILASEPEVGKLGTKNSRKTVFAKICWKNRSATENAANLNLPKRR